MTTPNENDNFLDIPEDDNEEKKTALLPLQFQGSPGNKVFPMLYKQKKNGEEISFSYPDELKIGQKFYGTVLDIGTCEIVEILEKRSAAGSWEINKYNGEDPEKLPRPLFYRCRVKASALTDEEKELINGKPLVKNPHER